MNTPRNRQVVSLLLVVGAVVFGMVLAGGMGMTAPGAADSDRSLSATQLAATSATTSTRGLPSFADLAQAVDPAVVSIRAATIEKSPRGRRRGQLQQPQPRGRGNGTDPFEFFFGPRRPDGEDGGGMQQPGQPEDFRSDAGGSGFIISRDGLIVTNNHVIEGATDVKVHMGNRDYTAKVRGADPSTDLALLKIEAGNDLRYLELGDSDRARVGDWVMVVGNPLNLDKTVTTGVISAKGRSLGINGPDQSFENFLQTDAAINFGNSGGPLINLNGEVVGIATAINYGAENIGFAVPVNTLKEVLPQLREKGHVDRGYLGIKIENLDYDKARSFGLKEAEGALVDDVTPGKPAAQAGIDHGDIILAVDGRKVTNTHDLISYVSSRGPTATVNLTLWRDGKTLDKSVKLTERPPDDQESNVNEKPEKPSDINWLGLDYQDLDQNTRATLNLPASASGVVITNVAPTSPLYDQGLRPGTVISEVNGKKIRGADEFERIVKTAKPGTYLRLYIVRYDRRSGSEFPSYIPVQVP